MLELLIVRHGESVADIEGRHEGQADFPLTDLGRWQAEQVAEWIAARVPPDLVIASPLRRAAETAEIIARRVAIPITLNDDLRELGNGVYAGLTFEEAEERYPWPEGGWKDHEAPPAGESRIAFRARIETFWSRLRWTTEPGKRIAIIAHGGVIQMLFQCFLRLPIDAEVWLRTGYAGMHLWRVNGDERQVLFGNLQAHSETGSPPVT